MYLDLNLINIFSGEGHFARDPKIDKSFLEQINSTVLQCSDFGGVKAV